MLPFELFVFATPVSRQARSRKKRSDWREEIRAKALEVQTSGESPWSEPVRVRIGYYFRGDSLDVDNILKAILDGLEGVVYTDDNLIADLIVSKRALDEFARMDVSVEFARALETGADFVHILVDHVREIEVMK
ncbi:MAG TPA: RusA family crossover junction endodeoxyribonuclease [Thermoanaerobaculia bacterium]|nr:RusA family crossover junction endodeoxyribonuclease [Thermoanaerobaculia bacterium]